VVRAVIEGGNYHRFAAIMEERGNVEEFLRRIEAAEETRRETERAEKEARRAEGKSKKDETERRTR